MSVSFEVSSNLYVALRASDEALQKAARMIGGSVEGHAKSLCPYDTGLLRNSITFAIGGEAPAITSYTADNPKPDRKSSGEYSGTAPADKEGEVTVYIGTNVEYAPYLELGHRQQPGRFVPAIKKKLKAAWVPARPFLRPALENNRAEIEQIIIMCMSDA